MKTGVAVICMLCTLTLADTRAFGQPATPNLTLDDLAALASARREKLNAVEVAFTVFQEPLRGMESSFISSIHRETLVDLRTDRYSVRRTIQQPAKDDTETVAFAFDGDAETTLLVDSLIGIVDDSPALNGRLESGILATLMLNPPEPDGLGLSDGSLESLLQHGVLRDEREDVDGHLCHVVDAILDGVTYATVWLDAERDLLPLVRVVYGKDGEVVSKTIVKKAVGFEETSIGERAWIPAIWETQAQIRGQVVRSIYEADVESITVNPIVEDCDFRFDFPPGTRVTDRVAGITYTICETGEAILGVSLEEDDQRHSPVSRPEQVSRADDHDTLDVGGQRKVISGHTGSVLAAPAQAPAAHTEPPRSPQPVTPRAVPGPPKLPPSTLDRATVSRDANRQSPEPRTVRRPHNAGEPPLRTSDAEPTRAARSRPGLPAWLTPTILTAGVGIVFAAYHFGRQRQ
ncbi:MAG: hypothetical protein KKB50_15735 [Planctomycetes bacterium]|nr:hypothetical protein [Planctomycetota bacterium]